MLFGGPVVPDGFGEDPEDRTKHDYAARKTEIAHDLEVIAMRVLNQESKECGLNGGIYHRKGSQSSSEEGMMANKPEGIAPDRNSILTTEIVFLPESLKAAHHGITADPHDKPQGSEEK